MPEQCLGQLNIRKRGCKLENGLKTFGFSGREKCLADIPGHSRVVSSQALTVPITMFPNFGNNFQTFTFYYPKVHVPGEPGQCIIELETNLYEVWSWYKAPTSY